MLLVPVARLLASPSRCLAALRGAPLPVIDRVLLRGETAREVEPSGMDPRLSGTRHPYFWAGFILSGETGPLLNK